MKTKQSRESPRRVNPHGGNDFQPMRFMEAGIRAMSEREDEKRFELSFSSEEPYARWFGMEILDHSEGCMDLSRLNSIGVLLFNHDTSKVVGKVLRAWNQDRRGHAEVQFDDDDFAEVIRKKVAGETLKGVSVRYSVDSWEEVMQGKQSADGRFTGPCQIAKKWTPLEISVVPVPADPTVGVGRSQEEAADGALIDVFEKMVQINENRIRANWQEVK